MNTLQTIVSMVSTVYMPVLIVVGLLLLYYAYHSLHSEWFLRIVGSFAGLLGLLFVAAGGGLGIPVVLNNTQLSWLSTVQGLSVWSLGYNTPGDFGSPLLYVASENPCPLNSGNGNGGTEVKSLNNECWTLVSDVRITPEMLGAKGGLLPSLYGGGLTTTATSGVFSGIIAPTSYIGATAIISGVNTNGNPLITTLQSTSSFADVAQVTQSPVSPSYFVSSYVIFGGSTSAGCSVGDALPFPAPSAGSASVVARMIVDTVDGGGQVLTAHLDRRGIYTNSAPYGALSTITLTGGTCSVRPTLAPMIDRAGRYIIAFDDTISLQNWVAAISTGYPEATVKRGGKYMLRAASIAPGGVNGSSSPTSILNLSGVNAPRLDLYGAEFINASDHNTDNGWSYIWNITGSDKGVMRGFDILQWPFPHRLDNMVVDHPTGTWGILLNGPANDWVFEDTKCRGSVVGVHILGVVGGYVQNPKNLRPTSDGCVYGATFSLARNARLESLYAVSPCRTLFLRSVYNFEGDASAQNAYCNTVLIENLGGSALNSDGIDLNYRVPGRLTTGSFTATTTINSDELTNVSSPDNSPFLWGLSGTGIDVGTVAVNRYGNKIKMSRPATATGTVGVTATIPANMYSFSSSEVTIGAGISGARYSNIKVDIDYDGTNYTSGLVPSLFSIQNFGSPAATTIVDTVTISGKAKNLPAGVVNGCSATGGNWDLGCLFNIGDHGSAPWSGSQAYNISIKDFTVVDNIGANPGGIHLDGALIANPSLSPFKLDRVLLPSASAFTVENDTINRSWDWPGRAFTFTPIWKFGGASVGQTYSTQAGNIIRNGKQVTANIRTTMTAKGSSTGSASIDLPYAPTSTNAGAPLGYCLPWGGMAAAVGNVIAVPGSTPSFGGAITPGTGGVTATLADTHFTNTSDIVCQLNYTSQ